MSFMKQIMVSVLMPCLNEAASITQCIQKAKIGLHKLHLPKSQTEIVVVDNGSTDESVRKIKKTGVRVYIESRRGYGNAYLKGFSVVRGKYIIMGDSDATYDFTQISEFYRVLQDGADIVLGSRFMGNLSSLTVMPFLNQYLGNPLLTKLINLFYRCHLTDSQTGFRAMTKSALQKMHLRSPGMELASEMIIKALSYSLHIREIPITYYHRMGKSKLSPFKDAWRHIQSILIYSPTYVTIIPGLMMTLVGILSTVLLLSTTVYIGPAGLGIHSLISAILLTVMGINIMLIGFFARVYSLYILQIPGGPLTRFLIQTITFNRLFLFGSLLFLFALGIILYVGGIWIQGNFQALAMEKEFVSALGLAVIGSQSIFSALLFGLLRNSAGTTDYR